MNNWVSLKTMPLIVSDHQDCSAFQQPAIEKTPTIQLKTNAFLLVLLAWVCVFVFVWQSDLFGFVAEIWSAIPSIQIAFISIHPPLWHSKHFDSYPGAYCSVLPCLYFTSTTPKAHDKDSP